MGVSHARRRIMKRLKFPILPIVVVALCVAGCPAPDKEPEDKPATPEEIRAQGQSILSDISSLSGGDANEAQRGLQQLQGKMRTFRTEHGSTETGKMMIDQITSKLYGNANNLFNRENYQACVAACSLALEINPTHPRTLDLQRRAREELLKPKVQLGGFFTPEEGPDAGELIAFLKVTYLTTGQTDSKRVKVGQEFDGYRFRKALEDSTGKPIGVVLRWLKTGKDVEIVLHGP
jgi:hypothetical protein